MTTNTFNKNNILKIVNSINIHQNIKLDYVVNEIIKKNINLKDIELGTLSRITYSDYTKYINLTIDDIFFIITIIFTLILILLKNDEFLIKVLKISNSNKQKIKKIYNIINYILGFFYIIYAIYMIKMLLYNKHYILVSRYIYLFTYMLAGLTIIYNYSSI